jgi:hypothetical protein
MMVSETGNQDSLPFGINGILVNFVARVLGIPDLFNTLEGVTAVGRFCLMDVYGYNAGNGFLPIYPSAWCRAFMGWTIPTVAVPGDTATYTMPATNLTASGEIVLVPINESEYFLVENRQRILTDSFRIITTLTDLANAETTSMPYNRITFVDSAYNWYQKAVYGLSDAEIPRGNVLEASDYDIGLPASGLLIWHVNQRVINRELDSDRVNANRLDRGVTLVEADGVHDIGLYYKDPIFGIILDAGGSNDVYPHWIRGVTGKWDNPTVTGTVKDSSVRFTPYTKWPTFTSDGIYTGITIDRIRGARQPATFDTSYPTYGDTTQAVLTLRDSSIQFTLAWGNLAGDWPRFTDSGAVFSPPFSHQGRIFSFSRYGTFYAYRPDGSAGKTGYTLDTVRFKPAESRPPYALRSVFQRLDSSREYSPLSQTRDSLVFSADTNLWFARLDATADTFALSSLPLPRPADPQKVVTIFRQSGENRYLVATADSGLVIISPAQELAWDTVFSGGVQAWTTGEFDSTGAVSICLVTGGDTLLIRNLTTRTNRQKALKNLDLGRYYRPGEALAMAAGNIDRSADREAEIVLAGSSGWVASFNPRLEIKEGWPLSFRSTGSVSLSLGDVNNDGYGEIVVGGDNAVYVIQHTGTYLAPWPRVIDSRKPTGHISQSIILRDLNGDGKLELAVPLATGEIRIINADGTDYLNHQGWVSRFSSGGQLQSPATLAALWPPAENSLGVMAVTAAGFLYVWRLPQVDTGTLARAFPWQTSGGAWDHTFYLPESLLVKDPALESGILTITNVYNWPNPVPASGSQTTVQYTLSQAARVRIAVYNSANRLLTGFPLSSGIAGLRGENKWVWRNLGKIAPGGFYCRIEAEAGGKKTYKFCKIAIIK